MKYKNPTTGEIREVLTPDEAAILQSQGWVRVDDDTPVTPFQPIGGGGTQFP